MGWWSTPTPRPLYPREREPVPIVIGDWVGTPGQVWAGEKNLAPPEFDPRTVQPVVSLYTDYTIPAPKAI